MRLFNFVLAVAGHCLLSHYAAATMPQSKSSIQAHDRELALPSDILSPDDFLVCMKKMVAGVDAYNSNTAMADVLNADVLGNNEFYQTTKSIFTRAYCEGAVDYIYDLSITSNYTERYEPYGWTDMATQVQLLTLVLYIYTSPRTLIDDAMAVMKDIHSHQERALMVSLDGDQTSDAFYPPPTGGYNDYTLGVTPADCPNRFRQGCTPNARGSAWSAFVLGKWPSRTWCRRVCPFVWHRPR